jgi:Uma2 family endonuclease
MIATAENLPTPLIAPTVEEWEAMTPDERLDFQVRVNDALSDPRIAMTEGRRHKKAKVQVIDKLGLHFGSIGRVIYLAEEMAVLYPGEETFSPDVLAVVGVAEPDDDPRMAWVVADEHKGIDWVLEVLHRGDRRKDLVVNVERYARLGIPEYFVYDRLHQKIKGYRLAGPQARRYSHIAPQAGRYSSLVLGLDLSIQGGKLRFFDGITEICGTLDLIGRLHGMVDSLEAKAQRARVRIRQERDRTQRAQVKAHRAQLRTERAQVEAEQALSSLRAGLLGLLDIRRIPCPTDARERVMSCSDPPLLQRWLLRAATVSTMEDVFETKE